MLACAAEGASDVSQLVLPEREHVAATMRPEGPQVGAVGVEGCRPSERFAVGEVVQVQEPAAQWHVFVVARIVHHHCAERGGVEPLDAQRLEHEIVLRGVAEHLIVRRTALSADEPVPLQPIEIPAQHSLQVIVGLERLPGAEIVLVVVLDQPEGREPDDAVVVGAKRGAGNRGGNSGVRRGVLIRETEQRHPAAGVERMKVRGHPSERRAELRAGRHHRHQQPGR